ncbi:MAG TPA: hypothetical protein VJN94_05855 [Candidatus Binataceae bacterium]|nr:hypothetical protein [Candidatus Binataceae bacterium]
MAVSVASAWAAPPFITGFTVSLIGSTVPGNGDVNPYGVAVAPTTTGRLIKGQVLVSNFNASTNLQGTGTTIVEMDPSNGNLTVFAQLDPHRLHGACPGGVGLTTALVALRQGWVIVGSLPTSDGTSNTAKNGCLIVLDANGRPVETIAGGPIRGPWDMTAQDNGANAVLFVTTVLNGHVTQTPNVVNRGSVVRIGLGVPPQNRVGLKPFILGENTIASAFPEKTDPVALIIGPTGVGLGHDGTLYVADTFGNRIAAIPNALTRFNDAGAGVTVSTDDNLSGPLGLAVAPNRDILTVNAGDDNIVETTPSGSQVAVAPITSGGGGSLFGLAVTPTENGIYFVDDSANTLNLFN